MTLCNYLRLLCVDGPDVAPIMAHVTAPTPMLQRRAMQKQISISPPPDQISSRYVKCFEKKVFTYNYIL